MIDADLEARLRAIEKIVSDNNDMLRKLRRGQRMAQATKAVYWLVLIVLGFVAIAFIKPYLSQLGAAYGLGGSNTDTSSTSYGDLLKTLNQ